MKSLIDEVKNAYDAIGLDYSLTRPHLTPETISFIPPLPPQARVLDLGCGNGVLLTAISKDLDYTGIDISQVMIEKAKQLHPDNKFIQADITDAKLWSSLKRYDFITALGLLHHLPTNADQLFVLNQIKNHLKPGGTALVSVWRLWKLKYLRFHLSLHHLMIPFHAGPKRFFYAFTQKEIENLCRKASLNIIKVTLTKNNLSLQLKRHLDNTSP